MKYQIHPAANVFPMMEDKRFAELKEDIKQNGLREPITLCDGMVLDGRNRYKACEELGIEPSTRNYSGNPWSMSWSLNGARRDLEDTRRALIKIKIDAGSDQWTTHASEIAAKANAKRSEAAKAQHEVSIPRRGETMVLVPKEQAPNESTRAPGRTARAQAANVSSGTQAKAEWITNKRPDLADQIISGDIRPAEALRIMKRDEVAKKVDLPTSKYRVIYADPPWSYGNTQPDYQTEQRDHYPVMPLSDICAIPVSEIADDNAVLFLWVTSPILEESFQVVKAWGFKYKASFIWDKIKHNMGHYNSVRHELLLICVRGSCQPDERKLFDSVQSIERGEHSKKPDEFRTIIDTIYPVGKRIELFARSRVAGWEAYGHQA